MPANTPTGSLTKNVRNEVGAGNDIFNKATAAAQDLSAAGSVRRPTGR